MYPSRVWLSQMLHLEYVGKGDVNCLYVESVVLATDADVLNLAAIRNDPNLGTELLQVVVSRSLRKIKLTRLSDWPIETSLEISLEMIYIDVPKLEASLVKLAAYGNIDLTRLKRFVDLVPTFCRNAKMTVPVTESVHLVGWGPVLITRAISRINTHQSNRTTAKRLIHDRDEVHPNGIKLRIAIDLTEAESPGFHFNSPPPDRVYESILLNIDSHRDNPDSFW